MQRLFASPMDLLGSALVAMTSAKLWAVPATSKYVISVKSVQKVQIGPCCFMTCWHQQWGQCAFDLEETRENSGLPYRPQEDPLPPSRGRPVRFAGACLYPSAPCPRSWTITEPVELKEHRVAMKSMNFRARQTWSEF